MLPHPWASSCTIPGAAAPSTGSPRAGDTDRGVTSCFGKGLSPSWAPRKGGLCSVQVEIQRRKPQVPPCAQLGPYHCELSSFVLEDLRLWPHSEHHGPLLPGADAEPEAGSTEWPWRALPTRGFTLNPLYFCSLGKSC